MQELDRLHHQINNLFSGRSSWMPEWISEREYPAVNVMATDKDVIVQAELPGVPMDKVDLTITGNVLTLRAECLGEPAVPEEAYQRRERTAGTCARTIRLPERVSGERAEASLVNGVLEVRIPKSPETQPRKIAVKKEIAQP